ncbi:MAG: hypothetical protein PF495_20775 [Spirochaetales bacterium]|jgi:hypothetical protein|nr:hypothetical protein [Spirochaetales bacterium]
MTHLYIETTEDVHEVIQHMAGKRGCSTEKELWFLLYQLLQTPSRLDHLERRARGRESDDEWGLFQDDDDPEQ